MLVPTQFRELSRRQRSRLIAASAIRTTLSTVALLVLYAVFPIEAIVTVQAITRLLLTLGILVAVIALQVQAIKSASYPIARAIEAIVIAVTVFIVLFALFYLGLNLADVASFNQPLDRVSAFYFTVTTLATVGFGDIAPKSDVARVIVTTQMLLDLALVAIVARVFFSVARSRTTSD